MILSQLLEGLDHNEVKLKINSEFKNLIEEIHEHSSIQIILDV